MDKSQARAAKQNILHSKEEDLLHCTLNSIYIYRFR